MAASTGLASTAADADPVVAVVLIALLHVFALPVVAAPPSPTTVLALEGLVLLGLAVLTGLHSRSVTTTAVTAAGYAVAVGLVWAVVQSGTDLWVATLGLVTALAVLGYGLHRFELVALGLVEVADE